MPEPSDKPTKPALPQRSRIRQLLHLGPSKSELRAEVALWSYRKEAAQRAGNDAVARAKAAEALTRKIRADAQAAVAAAAGLVQKTRDETDEQLDAMRQLIHDGLNEPERTDGCIKVRFHRQPEADDWLLVVAGAGGEDPEVYETYDCKVCPRSPVTNRRYWHVGHRATEEAKASKAAGKKRRDEEAVAAKRNGTSIRQRIDPKVFDQLRKIRDSAKSS